MSRSTVPKCPKCGAEDVLQSHRRGPMERILSRANIYPYRCSSCKRRFFAHSQDRKAFSQANRWTRPGTLMLLVYAAALLIFLALIGVVASFGQ